MYFNKISILSSLLILSFSFSNAHAQSSVWKVSKGDNYFYLGGTVHLLAPEDHPLPKEFMAAYKDSDKLIFETDIEELKTTRTQEKFLSAMMYSNQENLKSHLKDETYLNLKGFLASRNIPIEAFLQFKPWAVALNISVLEYQRLGMLPEHGVEEYFHRKSISDNKELSSLESINEQISFLMSMERIEPNIMVNLTLRDLEQLPEFIIEMKSSWRSGDIENFTKNSVIVQMKADFPEIYKTIVTDRNNNWMSRISTLNDSAAIEFVLVGALHLNGTEGLLNQLRSIGFDITQL